MHPSLALLLPLTLLACAPAVPAFPPPTSARYEVPRAAPEFSKATLGGARIDTKALRGKVVVFDFFASYCDHCEDAYSTLASLHARAGDDVVVVGVAEDEHEADARKLVEQFKLPYAAIHDRDNALSGRFRVKAMPVAFVVDKAGAIRWVGDDAQAIVAGVEAAVRAAR